MSGNHEYVRTYGARHGYKLAVILLAGLLLALQAPVLAGAAVGDPPPDPVATTSLLVKMVAGLSDTDQQAVIGRDGGVESSVIAPLRLHVVDVDSTQLADVQQRYASDPDVQRVEVEKTREAQAVPSDTNYGQQWALPQIGWDQAYGTVVPSGSATIAVLDTGVDGNQPDLAGRLVPGFSAFADSSPTVDPNGHGTAMATIAAAGTDDATGIAGVAYAGVQVMPVQVLGAAGLGQDGDIIAGVVAAADAGANVILMSFSSQSYSPDLQDAISYAWGKGAVLVAATGNDALATPSYPAGDAKVIGVSATDSADALWSGSNYGADVFIAAPGVDVLAGAVGGGTTSITGTSASAAIVAGSAALLRANDPSASNAVIVGRLGRNADAAGSADQTGNGRVNLNRALTDISTDAVVPVGSAPSGAGGPFVGPYVAADKGLDVIFAGTGTGSVAITGAATCTATCGRQLNNTATGTVTASAGVNSVFAGWSAQSAGITGCSGGSCNFSMGGNAQSATATFNLVSKTTPVITWATPADIVYGTPLSATQLNATASVAGTFAYTPASGTQLNAGNAQSLSVTFTPTDTANFNSATKSVTINVTKAVLAVNADPKSKVYGSTDPTATSSLSGFVNGDTAGSVTVTGSPVCSIAAHSSSVGTYANVYSCTPGTLAAANYTFAAGTSGTLTISKAVLAVNADAKSKVYGSADPAATITLSGFVNGDTAGSVTVTGSPVCSIAAHSSSLGTHANVYGCTPGTLATANYAFAAGSQGTLTITAAVLNVDAGSHSKVYGTSDPAATYTLSGFVNGDTAGSVTVVGSPVCSIAAHDSSVGTYANTYSCTPGTLVTANYTFAAGTSGSLTITAAVLNVDAGSHSKVYGTSDPAATYTLSGFVNGDTAATVTVTGSASCVIASHSSSVGTYANVYSCTPGTLATANYTFAAGSSGSLTINQAVLAVNADAKSKVYGSADPAATTTLTGFVNGDTAATVTVVGSPACSIFGHGETVGSYADTYRCTPGTLATANYTFTAGTTGSLTITKAMLNVDAGSHSKIYGDADPAPTYTMSGFVGGDNSVSTTGAPVCSVAVHAETVGTYANVYSCLPGTLATANYTFAAGSSGSLTITQAVLAVNADAKSKVYGSADPAPTSTLSGFVNGDTAATVTVTGSPACSIFGHDETVGSYADTYRCLPGTLATAYYTFTAGTTGSLTITKAILTVNADPHSKIYGDADPAATYTLSGFVGGDNSVSTTGSPECSIASHGSSVGTYADTYTCTPGTLATANYTFIAGTSGSLTITEAVLDVNAGSHSKIYGDDDPAATYTFSGFVNGDTAATVTVTGAADCSIADHGETVGTYADTYSCTPGTLDTANYTFAAGSKGSLTITERAVTITADAKTKVYGSDDPALTYQITDGSLAYSDEFTGALTRDGGENVGSYAITRGTVALSANYVLSYVGADLTITKAVLDVDADPHTKIYGDDDPAATYTLQGFVNGDNSVSTTGAPVCSIASHSSSVGTYADTYSCTPGTLASANYTFAAGDSGSLTITTRAVTITADAKTKVYGSNDPALTYQITDGSLAYSDAFSGALTRDGGENVGSYAITQGTVALNANYTLSYVGADLTITKAVLDVNAGSHSKIYGNTDPSATYTFSGFVNGDTAATVTVTGSADCSIADHDQTVGTYADIYSCTPGTLDTANYTFAAGDSGSLTIATRAVTITADAKTKVYGEADPTLTYQITTGSLAYTDDFSGSLTRDGGENVSSYAITQGTVALNANYTLTYVGADLTITKAVLNVDAGSQSKIYGDDDPAPTYTLQGFVNCDSDATVTVTGSADCSIAAHDETVGTYADTYSCLPGTLDTANYTFTAGDSGSLTITTRAVTITADAKSKVYGEADPALTYQITVGSLAYSDAFIGSLARAAGANVGSYAISQGTVVLNANYVLSYVGANLAITTRAVTITADAKSKVYGEADPALTYHITVGSLAYLDAFSGSLTRAAGANVGSYAIGQGSVALNTNYALSFVGADLSITTRAVTITADAKSKVYGEADPALTDQITVGSLAYLDAFSGSLTRAAGNNVGSYAINQGSVVLNANYVLSYVGANLTITPRALTITADNKSMISGGSAPAFTATPNGFAPGEGLSNLGGALGFVVRDMANTTTVTVGSTTPAGSYLIVPSGYTSSNYNIAFHNGTLNVSQRIEGFYSPVDMTVGPTLLWNMVKGGSTVPLKFRVFSGAIQVTSTTGITLTQSPVTCAGGILVPDDIPAATGGTGLRYDTSGQQFIFNWSVPSRAGQCYLMSVHASDGSVLTNAYFKTK